MAFLIARKLALILILLPLLTLVRFWVASTVLPLTLHTQYRLVVDREATSFVPAYRAYVGGLLAGDLGSSSADALSRVVVTPLRNSLVLLQFRDAPAREAHTAVSAV